MEFTKMIMMTLYARQQKRHRCKEQTFGLSGRRQGWDDLRIALKHVYYHMWNRSPVQVQCMRQGPQGCCTGMTLRDGMGGRWEQGSGWGTHVHPWLIHVNVWQNPLQYCKVISPQLNKINYFLKISNIVRHWPNLLILLAEYVYLCWLFSPKAFYFQ